ncbi:TetR/AcrR family transcriptional regulator [Demequina capsici]|uniref:TetR/AcrR family transcriptional regulator n=1 Tax=Demequina capsici TaxID=3075620 RepID=A0AA96F7G6_9MICO|nr:TetR/AcrR family transcriptional regulator [Demequina sp. OYTSA14]WNM25203.1 TetR/AcrR family transcriptional regulator [Demequina sp. OYTSA14]
MSEQQQAISATSVAGTRDEERRALVGRVAATFAAKGYHGGTLESIARESDVDLDALRDHFGDRVAVLLEVLEWHDMQGIPDGYGELTSVLDLYDRMSAEELVEAFLAVARSNADSPGLVQLLSVLTAEAGAPRHPARPALQQRHELLRGIIAQAISARREATGGTTDPLSPEERATAVIATWEGLQTHEALHPRTTDLIALLGHTLRSALELPPRVDTAPDGSDARA